MLIAAISVIGFAALAAALLWRLAIYALPLWCGGAAALWAYRAEAGLIAALATGVAAATAILIIGHLLLGATKSPLLRAGIGLAFATPAAIAGYHASHGIAAAFQVQGWGGSLLSGAAGMMTGIAAWGGALRQPASETRIRLRP